MFRRWLVLAIACDRSPPPPAPSTPPDTQIVAARTVASDPPAARGAMSPNLAGTPEGVLATWIEPAPEGAHRLRFARLVRGAWTAPSTIAEGAAIVANAADVPSVARQVNGTLVAHWAEKTSAHGYGVVLARSVDGGVTWRRLGSPHRDGTDTEHGFVSLAPDGDAMLAIWLDGRATASGPDGATALRAAVIGASIGDERVLDARVCDCCSTAVAMTREGPIVAYRDRSADELRDPSVVSRAEAWSEPRSVHADRWQISACPVNGPAMVASGHDVAVAWFTDAGRRPRVRIAFSRDAGRTFEPAVEVAGSDAGGAPMGRVDAVLDGADALVSWVALAAAGPRVRIRRIARDGRLGPVRELAVLAAAREHGVPRLERGGDELVVAWADAQHATVRVARLAPTEVPPVTARP